MSESIIKQLERIKNALHMRTYLKRPLMIPFDPDDVDWLVEQAEQTESFKQLHKSYLDRYVTTVGERNSLLEENKRLREALEFYATRTNYYSNVTDQWEPVIPVSKDQGFIARKVLLEGATE